MYTASAIEDIIRATFDDSAKSRQRHLLRQSLLNLVRLAQAEQRVDVQASVGKATQAVATPLPA